MGKTKRTPYPGKNSGKNSKPRKSRQPNRTPVQRLKDQMAHMEKRLTDAGVTCKAEMIDDRHLSRGESEFLLGFDNPNKRTCLRIMFRYNRAVDLTKSPLDMMVTPMVVGVSGKHRQAVIRVDESDRTLTRTVSRWGNKANEDHVKRLFESDQPGFSVMLPENTKYEMVPGSMKHKNAQWHAKVIARVPASTAYFLVGYDEAHMFVSMLPGPVTSVADAHRLLMPKEVRGIKGVIRQGEFFLVPCTKKELDFIKANTFDRNVGKQLWEAYYEDLSYFKDGEKLDSDHMAQFQLINVKEKEVYLTGWLGNPRHFNWLNGWYRVVVNTELGNPTSQQWD